MSAGWTTPLRMGEVPRGGVTVALVPDADERAVLARRLGLAGLPALSAEITVEPWLDGVRIRGAFSATVEQVCGVSLEVFAQPAAGTIDVRIVPAGSPNAAAADSREIELDPDSDDPPDVLQGDAIDLAAYVAEHLSLEIDPFPRRPGAAFDYAEPPAPDSPFAALKALRPDGD